MSIKGSGLNKAPIPYGRHHLTEEDIQSVIEVLGSDFLTQGPTVPKFEKELSKVCKAKHAVVVNSATSALHIAYKALGLGQGDMLWTSPNTFVATANAALYCGASVDFVDINSETGNLCVTALETKLVQSAACNTLPKILTPVHFAGQPCDMKKIFALSRKYGFRIVEDASHAIGSTYLDAMTGSCRYSDITVFSFHPVKVITTGEGGAATTNDDTLAQSMNLLRSHGVLRTKSRMFESEVWNYHQVALGFNYRMTDLQAALGISQLRRLNDIIDMRRKIAKYYDESFAGLPIKQLSTTQGVTSSHHLYQIIIDPDEQKIVDRNKVYGCLTAEKINVNIHYIPVYRHPLYRKMGFNKGHCPKAEHHFQTAITIPLFETLTRRELDRIVSSIRSIFGGFREV